MIFFGVYRAKHDISLSSVFVSYGTHVVSLLLPLLRTTTQTQDKMQGRLLLNVVIVERTTILKLFPGEDQALLVRGDTTRTRLSAKRP